jgi:hypothetical protein
MAIVFACPRCRSFLSISTRKAGQAIRCPKCRQEQRVPSFSDSSRPAPKQRATAKPYPISRPFCPPNSLRRAEPKDAATLRHPYVLATGLITLLFLGAGLSVAFVCYALKSSPRMTEVSSEELPPPPPTSVAMPYDSLASPTKTTKAARPALPPAPAKPGARRSEPLPPAAKKRSAAEAAKPPAPRARSPVPARRPAPMTRPALPPVPAKPVARRTEPLPPPAKKPAAAEVTKPAAPRPQPLVTTWRPAPSRPTRPAVFVLKRRDLHSAEELRKQLLGAPVVDLETVPQTGPQLRREAARFRAKRQIFPGPALLQARRADLAGLGLSRGLDCQLGKEPAESFQVLSRKLRVHLAACLPQGGSDSRPDTRRLRDLLLADSMADRNPWREPEAVPVLVQMLQVENQPVRLLLVELLAGIKGAEAGRALAVRALVDLCPQVREAAVRALDGRPRSEYRDLLLAGLRYPWPAVADHAAESLVALWDHEAVPILKRLLCEPDPNAPYLVAGGKQKVFAVQQVVRINHLRNCLLCHAPSFAASDPVRGAVPVAGRALPASSLSPQYYLRGVNFVRADTTYLRQDFSVMQTVAEPGPWPAHQRDDYVIRERQLTGHTLSKYLRQSKGRATYEQREAVLFALRELTGQDLGPDTAARKQLPSAKRPLPRLADLAANPDVGGWKQYLASSTSASATGSR